MPNTKTYYLFIYIYISRIIVYYVNTVAGLISAVCKLCDDGDNVDEGGGRGHVGPI